MNCQKYRDLVLRCPELCVWITWRYVYITNQFPSHTQSPLLPQIIHPTVSPSHGAIEQSLTDCTPVCTSVLTLSRPHTSTASLTDPVSHPVSSSLQSTTVSKVHPVPPAIVSDRISVCNRARSINTQDWNNIMHVYNRINTYRECYSSYVYYYYLCLSYPDHRPHLSLFWF